MSSAHLAIGPDICEIQMKDPFVWVVTDQQSGGTSESDTDKRYLWDFVKYSALKTNSKEFRAHGVHSENKQEFSTRLRLFRKSSMKTGWFIVNLVILNPPQRRVTDGWPCTEVFWLDSSQINKRVPILYLAVIKWTAFSNQRLA